MASKINNKVLIVDDSESGRETIAFILKRIGGYEVHTADNGKIGVEKAMEVHPDLILMDMDMPVMDGREATRTLRQQGYEGVIAAWTNSIILTGITEAGCNYIFNDKGVDPDEFIGTIGTFIEQKELQDLVTI